MHLPSKNVPMNINPQAYLMAYLSVSVKDTVRSHAIPTISRSWALPLRQERITSWDNPIGKGALTMGSKSVNIFRIDRWLYLIVSMGAPLWLKLLLLSLLIN